MMFVNLLTVTVSEKGRYVGALCDNACHPKLLHVVCNPISSVCECEKGYPVKLNPFTGCSKRKLKQLDIQGVSKNFVTAKRLGEQCYYRETCQYTDQHSSCVQIHHNAICQCEDGYHSVSIQKPSKRVFCAEGVAYTM